MHSTQELEVDGKTLTFSNLEKVLYPATGFTKGGMLDYYARIAPFMLPHLKDRAMTLKRYPNGVDELFFYEKNCPAHAPGWIRTIGVWSEQKNKDTNHCLLNDRASLLWAANLGSIELHVSLARKDPDRPTVMVFDLDPGDGCDLATCCEVSFWLKARLDADGLQSCAKTSGSKGLQLYVPLNTPTDFDRTKDYALNLALALEQEKPDRVTHYMRKELRKGRIFIDWSQNDRHKTTVAVYSMRAKQAPRVSTPVSWDEVAKLAKNKKTSALEFSPEDVIRRCETLGELFEPVLKLKQKLK